MVCESRRLAAVQYRIRQSPLRRSHDADDGVPERRGERLASELDTTAGLDA